MSRKTAKEAEVNFTNLEKVFFPATKFTKGDLIKYYIDVAPTLLPHFRDRPVTLIRMPDGVRGERFFEKNAPGHTPDWVQTTVVPRTEGGVINYIMINDAATLAWCANLATVELHPFLHRAEDIQVPTHLAFDLDPGEGADLLTCIEVAFMIRSVLDGLKLRAFPKVTGSKGLQLYVPLNSGLTYDSVTPFAKAIAELMHREHPDLVVSDMAKALRVEKVFIDWSQNHEKKTTVGPYSVRGKRDAPFVSMPVTWDELKRAQKQGEFDALYFSPADALRRIARKGDLFAPVLQLKQKLPPAFAARSNAEKKSSRPPAALRRYAEKRDFARTAEPGPSLPTRSAQGSRRRFVIQKHAASHLHYDFRLEMHDVLKSWAVPKGLPTEPGVRRSAFETEDHPLEYFSFEGVIPEGEYGGGTVMVWDIGTYDVIGGNYWKGDLKVYLTGKKLKGEWRIYRKESGDGAKPVWLIEKTGGGTKPITARRDDQSALSGRSMRQIADARDAVWQSKGEGSAVSERRRRTAGSRSTKRKPSVRKRSAAPAKPPEFVEPMNAQLVDDLPSGAGWVYELKFDGYRALGLKHGDDVQILSRKAKDIGRDFPAVVEALKSINADTALIDGEIVALDRSGHPSFQLLQQRTTGGGTVVFYAFDLLNVEGEDWRDRSLAERKARLEEILDGSAVKFSASFRGPAARVVAQVRRLGLEGVIGKRGDSKYESGERRGAWVKIKFDREQEFVVGGYTRGRPMHSLVVGYYDRGKLICVGRVPGGLNPHNRKQLHARLRPLESDVCPFANLPSATRKSILGGGITAEEMKNIQWVMPRVVLQVGFAEWTTGGNLRHASFKGMREDKAPEEVVKEVERRA